MKKILSICLCLAMVLGLFVGCGQQEDTTPPTTGHKHSFAGKAWSGDDDQHWYTCECGLKMNQGNHMDADVDGNCDICAYQYVCNKETGSKEHTYEETWTSNETHHWHAANCSHYGAAADKAEHSDENNDGVCDVCAYGGDHTHTYEDKWSSDDKQHWHAASCGHDVKRDEDNHADRNLDGACDVCGWSDPAHTHTFSTEWSKNAVFHWHAATCEGHSGAEADKAQHADANGDKLCDDCGWEICEHSDFDNDGMCDSCGWYDPDHTHAFEQVHSDKTGHWYTCTDHPGAASTKEEHVDAGKDGVCDVCQFQICGHSFSADWTSDETHHWKDILCTCNIPRKDYAPHTLDSKGVCTECMYGYIVESVYEVVVDKQPHVIEFVDKMYTFSEFTVSFPQPGKYVLYPSDERVKISDVDYLDAENHPLPTDPARTFVIEEACEMTLYFYLFDFNWEPFMEVPITYSLVRMDDVIVDTLKGKVELPTNTTYILRFSAPEVGSYKLITSVTGVVIGMTEDSMEYFRGHISFDVTEVGQEFTFYIRLDDLERESFIFDWFLEPPFCLSIGDEGNFAVVVSPGQIDYKIEFTAPEAGYYSLSVDPAWLTFCYWSETHKQPVRGDGDLLEKQQILTPWLEAGEVFTTWLQTVYNYPDSVDCQGTLTVTNIGQMLEGNDVVLTPGKEGGKYTFNATETLYYCLSVENGEIGIIGANGTVSWTTYYEAKVQQGYSYSFMVRGEGDVHLTVTTKQYSITLNQGDNTVTLVPNKEYVVAYGQYYPVDQNGNVVLVPEQIDTNRIIKLYWTNPSLVVYVDGAQVQSGALVELLHNELVIMVRGRTETDVDLTLEVTNPQQTEQVGVANATLQLNQTAVMLINGEPNPAVAEFTAPHGGTFKLEVRVDKDVQVDVSVQKANGETVYVFSADGEGTEDGATVEYEFQLEAGETITFMVRVPGEDAENAYLTVSNK